MRFARLATTLALASAIAFVGVPQADFLFQELDRQEREIFFLRKELHQLIGSQERLGQTQQNLLDQHGLLARKAEQLSGESLRLSGESMRLSGESLRLNDAAERLLLSQDALHSALDQSRSLLSGNLEEVQDLRRGLRDQAATLASYLPSRRLEQLRQEVLAPVFQLSGRDAVGSAVLIHRGVDEEGAYYLALSCFHVVRDILEEREEVGDLTAESVGAVFLDTHGVERRARARMIAYQEERDLALLRLDSEEDLGPLARLAPRARAAKIGVFEAVYTVGCPLGTATQATAGEVTRKDWAVDGQDYWMVSSPAYFGNSGGGVFLKETHELVGVFAKIYTHGSYRPQVVTHMGLSIPLDVVYDWLESIGHEALVPANDAAVIKVEEATVRAQDPIQD